MDQTQHIEKIHPIHVPRERGSGPRDPRAPEEVHELRRLNGLLQHAAVQSRPDLAAKVGYLQSRYLQSQLGKGRAKRMIEANRELHAARRHKPRCLRARRQAH